MKKLVLFGSGGHCRAVLAAVMSSNMYQVEMIGDIHNTSGTSDERIFDAPVVSLKAAYNYALENNTSAFVAVGDNHKRHRLHVFLVELGLELVSIIHPTAIVSPKVQIGAGSYVAANCHIGPEVEVGESTILNTMCNIEHESRVGSFCHVGPNSTVCGRTHISDCVFLGASSTVLPYLKISKNIVVGAGGVVTRDLVDDSLAYTGVPAIQK